MEGGPEIRPHALWNKISLINLFRGMDNVGKARVKLP